MSQATPATNFSQLLPELNGGLLIEKLNTILSDVALGVMYSDAKKPVGKVVLEMVLEPIGESTQIRMQHSLSFVCPTKRGKRTEVETTETPLHVGQRGRITAFPERQEDFFATREPQQD